MHITLRPELPSVIFHILLWYSYEVLNCHKLNYILKEIQHHFPYPEHFLCLGFFMNSFLDAALPLNWSLTSKVSTSWDDTNKTQSGLVLPKSIPHPWCFFHEEHFSQMRRTTTKGHISPLFSFWLEKNCVQQQGSSWNLVYVGNTTHIQKSSV